MLSTEAPPDPSSSFPKIFPLKSDERAPLEFALQEADPAVLEETATPTFCIRDYVFASRSKGILANWPFTKDSLHHCLKHDIKDPLPPFEAPALVKVQCLEQITRTDQLIARSKGDEIIAHNDLLKTRNTGLAKDQPPIIRNDSCLQSEEVVLDCSDQENNSTIDEGKSAVHPGTSLDRGLRSIASILENSEPVYTAEKFLRRLEKKCRLPVKSGVISGINRSEDIASNSSVVSESMASKVCPVCKTFSSTSNTTLNAHIDQCLSMESNTSEVLSKFPKLNVKPRKKRLMVDIYRTASCYTLEDLDKRNGTNWTMEIALLAQPTTHVATVAASDTNTTIEPRYDKREGSVYVDSKGIKVRILSNFNNISLPNKDIKLQRHKKDLKRRENSFNEKPRHIAPNQSTKMKLKGPKRKLSLFHTKQIPVGNEKTNNRMNDESLSKPWTDQSKVNSKSHLSCQSSCSPNPDSPQNSVIDFAERIVPGCNMLAECDQLDLSNSNSMKKHSKKLSRSPEDLIHSTGTKRADFPCRKTRELPVLHSKSSVNDLVLRSSGNRTSTCTPNDYSGMTVTPSEKSQSLMDGQRNSSFKNNDSIRRPYFHLYMNETDGSENLPVYNKFQKHRSHSRTARRRREFPVPYNVGVPGISMNYGFDLGDKAKSLESCQSVFSKCVDMSDMGGIMNHISPSQRDLQDSVERENSNTMGEHSNIMDEKHNSSKIRPTRNECQMQVEISDSKIHNIGDDIVNLSPTGPSGMQMNHSSLIDGHHCALPRNKTNVQFHQADNIQYTHHDNVSSIGIINQYTERGAETLVREIKSSWLERTDKCHGDAVAVQQCVSSLTGHGDSGLEMHSKNSLTTSACQTAIPDKSSSSEHKHSSSPVSTASTVSMRSSINPNSNEPELDLLKNSVTLHNASCTAGTFTENSRRTQGKNIDGRILEAKETFRGEGPGNIFNNKPFCSSCKESLFAESQLLRMNEGTRIAEAKQISNFFTGPRMSSSFTTYQNATTSVASAASESHSFEVSLKNLVDSAETYPVFMNVGFSTPSRPQSQPPSNSVLQLMGKNLMVANNEGVVQPQTATSDYRPTVDYLSPSFASTNNFLKQDNLPYQHQPTLIGSSASSSRDMSTVDGQRHQQYIRAASDGFVVSPFDNNWVRIQGQQSQQKKPYERHDPCSSPYVMYEVITIDDSPEREAGFRGLVRPTSTFTPVAAAFNPLLRRPVARLPSNGRTGEVPGAPNPIGFRTYSTV